MMPKTKKKCAECTLLTERLDEVQTERTKLSDDLKNLLDAQENILRDLAEERQKEQKHMSREIQAIRDTHRLELIKLIVEGKKAEAVECLLRSDVILFSIDVRYADTATQIAAKKEQAESMATVAANAVRSALMPKEEPHV